MSYVITYRYADPSPAGPFTGRTTEASPAKKGDEIRAPFGRAIVTSCRKKEQR